MRKSDRIGLSYHNRSDHIPAVGYGCRVSVQREEGTTDCSTQGKDLQGSQKSHLMLLNKWTDGIGETLLGLGQASQQWVNELWAS
jgi:hypothetical protein